ncbi:MAG: chorismate mutase [Acidothermaceae bacterium]
MNQSLSDSSRAPTAPTQAADAADVADVADADQAAAAIAELREQIDAVDAELVAVVQHRIALSKQIQDVRISHGGRRREHSRELKIVSSYVDGLGRGGSDLALTLLELCRGRA